MRGSRVSGLLWCALILGLFGSCAQLDDILLKSSSTKFALEISKLPTAPAGMIYQLWVSTRPAVDTAAPTDVLKPLLRFNYLSSASGPFLADESGAEISFDQVLGVDIFDYSSVFVSVELLNDPDPARPASILMGTTLVQIADQVFTLKVPGSDDLAMSLIRYNMEGVSDNDRDLNDGRGVWFSNYNGWTDLVPDTLAITNITYTTVTMEPVIVSGDTINLDSLKASYRDSVINIRPETTYFDFGPDSLISVVSRFRHIGMRYDYTFSSDSTFPYTRRDNQITYQVLADPTPTFTRFLESFTQDDFNLPNLSRFGLKWKAWVMAPDAILSSTTLGRFTPPAWPTSGSGFTWFRAMDGRLLPVATFGSISSDDEDGNPFTFRLFRGYTCPTCTDSTYKIPDKPGEDFLNNTTFSAAYPGMTAPLNLLPSQSGNIGSVFVSLEPKINLSSNTNFPLIAHFAFLPSNRNTIAGNAYSITMTNGTSTTSGNPFGPGFPTIKVRFTRL